MLRAGREYLTELLACCDGNMTAAARIAGRHRGDFYKVVQRIAPELLTDPVRQARILDRSREHARSLPHRAWGGNAAWKKLDEARA